MVKCLISTISAPDDSPSPPPASVPGTSSDIRRDVVRTQDIVSGVRRDIVELQHVLRSRECDGSRHPVVSDIMVACCHGISNDHSLDSTSTQVSGSRSPGVHHLIRASSILGESPPPPPRACFGRDELVERLVDLVENFKPVAFIGPGGMGKTSIALTVLHHSRIKKLFGDNRRFIRCDQFTASRANLLSRLSKVTGAGIENPEDLTPLRPFLSSKEMFIVFDNAESILDPQGTDGQGIYRVVKEVSQFSNICVAITSRITTIPPDCKRLDIPPLSLAAARSAFHRIYDNNRRQDLIDKILEQLDFHPLSVTLLATIAHQNNWDNDRLAREWEQRQTRVLQTEQNESLAATIELSFTSPMFESLGPHARELLGVVAFFPQGVDENNLDQLFPTIPDAPTIFNKFCILSLTYQSGGFITMLTPLRDYLRPSDPNSSPLLRSAKEYYFTRMTAEVNPNKPGFRETQWIILEDANIEHLLSVYLSGDASSDDIWSACANFMKLLYWHKPQQTLLSSKIEALPDDHPSKPECLTELARLIGSTGNRAEQKRLLECTLRLERERGDDDRVALTLSILSDANRMVGLYGEGIDQAKEAMEIYERIGHTIYQADSLITLASLLYGDEQLDAAEEAASRVIDLLAEKGQEFQVCQSHRILGNIHRSKDKREEAIHHYETAIRIAIPPNWEVQLFWNHYSLAQLFLDEDDFYNAHAHIERAKSHTVDDGYHLGRAVELQAMVHHRQHRFLDATSEALRALEVYKKLGALGDIENCECLLRDIEESRATSGGSNPNCELPESMHSPAFANSLLLFPACASSTSANAP